MVRADLKRALADENPDLSQADIDRIVSAFFGTIISHLARGGRVELRGFGSFMVRAREARIGRNPRTGEPADVAATHIPRFKASKAMRDQGRLGDDVKIPRHRRDV